MKTLEELEAMHPECTALMKVECDPCRDPYSDPSKEVNLHKVTSFEAWRESTPSIHSIACNKWIARKDGEHIFVPRRKCSCNHPPTKPIDVESGDLTVLRTEDFLDAPTDPMDDETWWAGYKAGLEEKQADKDDNVHTEADLCEACVLLQDLGNLLDRLQTSFAGRHTVSNTTKKEIEEACNSIADFLDDVGEDDTEDEVDEEGEI